MRKKISNRNKGIGTLALVGICALALGRDQSPHLPGGSGGEPVYKCAVCGLGFADHDLLQKHINETHQGETPNYPINWGTPVTPVTPAAPAAAAPTVIVTPTGTVNRCPYCGLEFGTNYAGLHEHIVSMHSTAEWVPKFSVGNLVQAKWNPYITAQILKIDLPGKRYEIIQFYMGNSGQSWTEGPYFDTQNEKISSGL